MFLFFLKSFCSALKNNTISILWAVDRQTTTVWLDLVVLLLFFNLIFLCMVAWKVWLQPGLIMSCYQARWPDLQMRVSGTLTKGTSI